MTPKQEKFCQAVASGHNYSESYRMAFNSEKMKPESVNNKAWQLMQRVDIKARISEIKAALAEQGIWTRVQSVQSLINVINHPDKTSDVVGAVKELNAMHGYNEPTKIDHTNSDGSLRPIRIEITALTDDDGTDSDPA